MNNSHNCTSFVGCLHFAYIFDFHFDTESLQNCELLTIPCVFLTYSTNLFITYGYCERLPASLHPRGG